VRGTSVGPGRSRWALSAGCLIRVVRGQRKLSGIGRPGVEYPAIAVACDVVVVLARRRAHLPPANHRTPRHVTRVTDACSLLWRATSYEVLEPHVAACVGCHSRHHTPRGAAAPAAAAATAHARPLERPLSPQRARRNRMCSAQGEGVTKAARRPCLVLVARRCCFSRHAAHSRWRCAWYLQTRCMCAHATTLRDSSSGIGCHTGTPTACVLPRQHAWQAAAPAAAGASRASRWVGARLLRRSSPRASTLAGLLVWVCCGVSVAGSEPCNMPLCHSRAPLPPAACLVTGGRPTLAGSGSDGQQRRLPCCCAWLRTARQKTTSSHSSRSSRLRRSSDSRSCSAPAAAAATAAAAGIVRACPR
jgi:hypothetical protein